MSDKLIYVPTLDSLIADPSKLIELQPEVAKMLLIKVVSLQPLLIQRALIGPPIGQEKDILLKVPDVAKQLQLSAYRVYELARQGTLKSVRLGKSVRVRPSAVAEYLTQQGAGH